MDELDREITWVVGTLVAIFIGTVILAIVYSTNSAVVCEINPLDTTDVFCYEPE